MPSLHYLSCQLTDHASYIVHKVIIMYRKQLESHQLPLWNASGPRFPIRKTSFLHYSLSPITKSILNSISQLTLNLCSLILWTYLSCETLSNILLKSIWTISTTMPSLVFLVTSSKIPISEAEFLLHKALQTIPDQLLAFQIYINSINLDFLQ